LDFGLKLDDGSDVQCLVILILAPKPRTRSTDKSKIENLKSKIPCCVTIARELRSATCKRPPAQFAYHENDAKE
jgi:hypothetical protein